MNKTIQSNSFRPFSRSLLAGWTDYFQKNQRADENFLVTNLQNCLRDFNVFAEAFEKEARRLAEQDPIYATLGTKEKKNFELWLNEKTSKALDVYWAQLSQAATQYTSPGYQNQLNQIIKLQPQIVNILESLNQLTKTSPDTSITINDILICFDELTLIRLAPYTKTALIGIPYRVIESASSDEDMLAVIAHELGHFLYWRLDDFDCLDEKHKSIKDAIKKHLDENKNEYELRTNRYISTWFEELFADFIGASIARDNHLHTAKSMVIRNNKQSSRAGNNDYEHVSDVLRPLISMYVLNNVQKDSLDAWKQFFRDDVQLDVATVKIELIGENEDERKIMRKAEELSKVLLATIDKISDEIRSPSVNGLFRPHFSNISNVEMLSRKAVRLANTLKESHKRDAHVKNELSALDVFLEPQTLEAGGQWHSHYVKSDVHPEGFWAGHAHA